jgi:hypothetical protein
MVPIRSHYRGPDPQRRPELQRSGIAASGGLAEGVNALPLRPVGCATVAVAHGTTRSAPSTGGRFAGVGRALGINGGRRSGQIIA